MPASEYAKKILDSWTKETEKMRHLFISLEPIWFRSYGPNSDYWMLLGKDKKIGNYDSFVSEMHQLIEDNTYRGHKLTATQATGRLISSLMSISGRINKATGFVLGFENGIWTSNYDTDPIPEITAAGVTLDSMLESRDAIWIGIIRNTVDEGTANIILGQVMRLRNKLDVQ